MNKIEVQQRVLQNGKPLDLDKFEWDEKTNTFSSDESYLVLDFAGINNCQFKTGGNCQFTTGSNCQFTTWNNCQFTTGSNCQFTTWNNCQFTTKYNCQFTTWNNCTFTTGSNCQFTTKYNCQFTTWNDCTFTTGSNCQFTTWNNCTFTTGSNCQFTTGSNCQFKTGNDCVIVRRDIFEIIQPLKEQIIQLCPTNISGYLIDGKLNGVPHIIADGILSKIISKKGNVYKVINHGETKQTYLIEKNGLYAHGSTIKQAKEDIVYKISNRDTSKYKSMNLETILTKEEAIEMYMVITGACSEGTKYFVKNRSDIKPKMTIAEVIQITEGQYNHQKLVNFFKK